MKYIELARLLADGQFQSGESLGEQLGLSRAAVWKQVKQLKNRGIDVHAVRGKGYRFTRPLELLNQESITQGLSARANECIDRLEIFSEIDSTNQYLLKQILCQKNKAYVCFAEYQKHGKGRRGRKWVSPYASNIYLSVLWRFKASLGSLEGISLVAAISVAQSLRGLGLHDVKIKWPNDVVYQGRKLAGILLETAGDFSAPAQIVLGIGLNIDMPQHTGAKIDQPWIDLSSCNNLHFCRNEIAAVLLDSLILTLIEYEKHGFEYYQKIWEDFDYIKQKPIRLSYQERVLQGEACGIDKRGALLVKTAQGLQAFHSGEVSIRLSTEQQEAIQLSVQAPIIKQ